MLHVASITTAIVDNVNQEYGELFFSDCSRTLRSFRTDAATPRSLSVLEDLDLLPRLVSSASADFRTVSLSSDFPAILPIRQEFPSDTNPLDIVNYDNADVGTCGGIGERSFFFQSLNAFAARSR